MNYTPADKEFMSLGFAKVGEKGKTASYSKYSGEPSEDVTIIIVTVIPSGIIVSAYLINEPSKKCGACIPTSIMKAALSKIDEFNDKEEETE